MSKCGILIAENSAAPTTAAYIKMAGIHFATLEALGYNPEIVMLNSGSTAILSEDGTNYDFFVVPRLSFEISQSLNEPWGLIAAKGESLIPCFIENYNYNAGVDTGANGSMNRYSSGDDPCRCSYKSTGLEVFVSCLRWEIDPANAANVEVLLQNEKDDNGVSDQLMVAWKYTSQESANNSPYYISSSGARSVLPLLLHEAATNGDIPVAPKKKQFCASIDDFPDSVNTKARIDAVHNYLSLNDLQATCGIHGKSGPGYQVDWPAFLAQQVANGGHFYTIDHQVSSDPEYFDWNLTDQGNGMDALPTVAEKQALALSRHMTVQDDFVALGLPDHGYNNGGWRFFNNNRVSADGLTVLADLGYQFVRLNQDGTTPGTLRSGGYVGSINKQQGVNFYTYRGLPGNANNYAYDSSNYIVNLTFAFQATLVKCFNERFSGFYAHNFDFYENGQSGKTGEGLEAWKNHLGLILYLSTIYKHVKTPLLFTE